MWYSTMEVLILEGLLEAHSSQQAMIMMLHLMNMVSMRNINFYVLATVFVNFLVLCIRKFNFSVSLLIMLLGLRVLHLMRLLTAALILK